MTGNLAPAGTDSTELERLAHYREQAAQFRQWAEEETVPEVRDGLLDMARQYERLASEIESEEPSPVVRAAPNPARLKWLRNRR